MYPKNILNLIRAFTRLPGIGPKTAERLVFYILNNFTEEFTAAVNGVNGSVTLCEMCKNFSMNATCEICANTKRDHSTIAIVAKPQDIVALERSEEYVGVYFVLGGVLSALGGITAENLRVNEMIHRIQHASPAIQEVLLAFDSNTEGESTMLYLTKQLKSLDVRVTRLARGLPVGSDVEYADEVTLGDALKNRQDI